MKINFFPESNVKSRLKNKHFTRPCAKVAVCLYGQYRVADWLMPYLAEIFKSTSNVKVDFFASVKLSKSYAHSSVELIKHNGKIIDQPDMSKETLQEKLNSSPVNFTKTNIIDMDYDEMVGGYKWGKLFHGVVDVINLKQQHERDNNFEYDIVILSRFDILIKPNNILERMVNWYNNISDNEFRVIFNGAKFNNWICSDVLGDGYHGGGLSGIQDFFTWGGSHAYDILALELIDFLETIKRVREPTVNHIGCQDGIDGHVGFDLACKRGGIGVSLAYPYLSDDDNLCFQQEFFMGSAKYINAPWEKIAATVVREMPNLNDIDPFSTQAFKIVADYWIEDGSKAAEVWEKILNNTIKHKNACITIENKDSDEQDDS